MSNRLLNKLVFASMKNNKKTLFPFLLATSVTIVVFYILASLAFGPFIYYDHQEVFYGAQTIAILLETGSMVVAVFAFIFIFYANQFVMKERKREIGLYGVLGLSRWNIGRMLIVESLINAAICLVSGLVIGTFLNKLMLLLLYKIVGQAPVEGVLFSITALVKTFQIFGLAFVVCCIYNIFSVNVGNPIELLRSNATGEKEPKVKWIMLVLGIVSMGSGYFMALTCKSPSEAIATIFEAIILVIIGTYFLFISGSIFVLKTLKNSKRFYYKTRNFVSISNLIYRMKHNAAGLASICILSTGVILLITCATALMSLGRKNINELFPSDIMVVGEAGTVAEANLIKDEIVSIAKNYSVDISDISVNTLVYDVFDNKEDGYRFLGENHYVDVDGQSMMYLFTADEYETLTGERLSLTGNQVYYADTKNTKFDNFYIQNWEFSVVGNVDVKKCNQIAQTEMSLFNNAYIVFSDNATRMSIYEGAEIVPDGLDVVIGLNVLKNLSETEMAELGEAIIQATGFDSVSFKAESEKFYVSIYGGVFFVGVFLAVLFLMATVLIIYYKQMSEGFEDKKRYEILKKVGLTDVEVRATIKRQVMILFFLPVLTAIIHMLVASKIVRLFFRVILVVDAFTFNMSIVGVAVVFLVIYAVVYKITSNEYYNIVN